jgi:DNA-binding beta-propeller fold protein YncE
MSAATARLADNGLAYDVDTAWARLPDGVALADVAAVAVGPDDRVYAFTRGEHPMVVLDADGTWLGSWGHGVFSNPHGLQFAPDGFLYCTDDGDHTVRRCTPDGEVVLTIGIPGRPAPFMSGRPFCRCTHTALSPDGDVYVSDGYGNAQVHCFAPDGRLRFSWGASGSDPGRFHVPHNICCDQDGWVYVADRENHRIQVFDGSGRFEAQWHDLFRPCALALGPGDDRNVYVGELGPLFRNASPWATGLGARVSVLDRAGAPVARLGRGDIGPEPDQFVAPHGLAVDSRGDVYVAEVARGIWPMYRDEPVPDDLTTLRKLTRRAPGSAAA